MSCYLWSDFKPTLKLKIALASTYVSLLQVEIQAQVMAAVAEKDISL
jgi:hypothetical protein